MTRRSRRYFYWKKLWKENAPLADMTKMFDRVIIADIMMEASKPRRYPSGTAHLGGPAIVGETGPEIVKREGMWDVTIKNHFTPFADGKYVKIDKP